MARKDIKLCSHEMMPQNDKTHTHTFRTRLTLLNIQIQGSFPYLSAFVKYTENALLFLSFLCMLHVIFSFGAPRVSTGKKVSMFSNIWETLYKEFYDLC
jgi:hypothetical protein